MIIQVFPGDDKWADDLTLPPGFYKVPNLEATFVPLMNFRSWVKKTDEITDHDLLVTAQVIFDAALGITEGIHQFRPVESGDGECRICHMGIGHKVHTYGGHQ